MKKDKKSLNLLKEAHKCKPANLKSLLEKIELAIKNSEYTDEDLFEAKTIVTTKIVAHYK